MRGYVFTNDEKKILNTYVRRGLKTRHFNVIMTLIRRNKDNLEQDLRLLNSVASKVKSSSRNSRRRGRAGRR
ncbi:MAG: hypothetical protein ACREBS_08460 [Nitrososphaerales archaeon]